MKNNFDKCFSLVLQEEGGYVNNPRDPGGRTNLGVTQAAWQSFVNRDVTESEMRLLTPDLVKPFYKAMYWDKIKGDQLPAGVDYATFDFAVNSGIGRAAKMLQQVAGVTVDGVLGPKSIEAITFCSREKTVDVLCDMRLDFMKHLSTWPTFGRGWGDRVARVKEKAIGMTKTQ